MTDQGPDQPTPENPLPPPPPPPIEPMQIPPASGVGAPGDLGNRFLARLIDHILLGIVTFVIIVPLFIAAMFTDVSGFDFFGGFSAGSLVSGIVVAVIVIGYFSLMESQIGQTVGKMLLNLRTEGPAGGKPTFEQALKRNAWYALAIIPILGGLAQLAVAIYIAVTINNSATRTGWHDTFAGGTRVVKTK
jgi:uncharacterized RDD family membrane protein YckC